jgi:hypothetical protein
MSPMLKKQLRGRQGREEVGLSLNNVVVKNVKAQKVSLCKDN